MAALTLEQKKEVQEIKNAVLRKFPRLGSVVRGLDFEANDNIGTAATNGKKVIYSPSFLHTLDDGRQTFLFAHEICHVAFDHIMRSKDKEPGLWNIATDSVINQILKSENLPMIEGGVDMPEALGKSAEEMYEKLLKEREEKQKEQEGQQEQNQEQGQNGQQGDGQQQNQDGQNQQQDGQQGGQEGQQEQNQEQGQNGQQGGQEGQQEQDQSQEGQQQGAQSQTGYSSHEIWKEAVEEAEKEKERRENPSLLDKIMRRIHGKEEETPEEDVDYNAEEKSFLEENKKEKEELAKKIIESLERAKEQLSKERVDNEGDSFGDVGEAKAVVNWKRALKKSVEEEEERWSYRRASRANDYSARIEDVETEDKSTTEVMLDVSGSVDNNMLKDFLRQLKPLLKETELKVGMFDHRVFDFVEIKTNKDIDEFRIRGGGGTDIDKAVRAFSKDKKVNKIVLTDGYGDMPRQDLKNLNVIWLIYDNDDFNPCCGKVIYVDREQIKRQNCISGKHKDIGR
ncbi:MAG: hypothetical protein IJS26_01120 [Alphaproteobacteria bacterium]|nr:hypothetical protein [Alphaproteobacteria bacterium]